MAVIFVLLTAVSVVVMVRPLMVVENRSSNPAPQHAKTTPRMEIFMMHLRPTANTFHESKLIISLMAALATLAFVIAVCVLYAA